MGLFERPELTSSIQRHLPGLISANHKNMRWKRFLFKQVCDRNEGNMCKTPNCVDCSDYTLCFAGDE
jgi:nitrogen fixation protein NifQ